ncbi:Arrestin domain-containing protein 17 [Blattella germanica]|nr:Arrestin domain-containing protein 17 [Blattella germanica]
MGLLSLELIFDNPQRTFFSGQTLTGRLMVRTDAPKNLRSIVIKFKGEAHVHWTGTEILPSGEHYYPFSMILPHHLPSSFEGDYGYIRYTVKAILDRPWKFDHEAKAAFTVLSHVDLNIDPQNRVPTKREKLKTFCCCCCKSGPLTLVTIIPAQGFVPGQHVPITVEVDNVSNVNINHYIRFHATSPPKTKQQHVTVQKVVLEGEVHENDSRTWAQNFTIPPLPPSQLRECRIIDLEYLIKIPITIGTIPLWEAPPSYEECMYGTDSIGDSDDNQHVIGITSYKPRYPTYNLSAPPPAYPGLVPK